MCTRRDPSRKLGPRARFCATSLRACGRPGHFVVSSKPFGGSLAAREPIRRGARTERPTGRLMRSPRAITPAFDTPAFERRDGAVRVGGRRVPRFHAGGSAGARAGPPGPAAGAIDPARPTTPAPNVRWRSLRTRREPGTAPDDGSWRRRPESNRRTRICSPVTSGGIMCYQ